MIRNIVIGSSHKGAVVTMYERKGGYAFITKVANNLKNLSIRVNTLAYDSCKEFIVLGLIDQKHKRTAYIAMRSMSTGGKKEIIMIQKSLNKIPRKRSRFKNLAEVTHQSRKRVALRT